jgi:hypothetical protein
MAIIGPFTAQDIINEAAELLGIVGPEGMENADDANSCLRTLNLMLSAWSADEISARAYITETFTIVGGQRQYTWGTSGTPDFNSDRPMKVVTAGLLYTQNNNLIIPMEVGGSDHYEAFGDRLIVSGPPQFVFPDMLMPNAVMNLYPIPDQGYDIVFTSIKDLAGMTDLNTPFTIDGMYYQPMVYNLAMAMAPKFGKKPDAALAAIAMKGYGTLVRITSPDLFFGSDFPSSRTGLNAPILDGGYGG